MIFGNNYDTSLWLMLSGNRKNKKKVVEFIKEVPEELFYKLYDSLSLLKEYEEGSCFITVNDFRELNGNVSLNDNVSYWYCIDIFNGGLNLGKSVVSGEGVSNVFELSLSSFDRVKYNNISTSNEMYLGTVTCSLENKGKNNVVELGSNYFVAVKVNSDKLIVKSCVLGRDNRYKYFPIGTGMIPDDYSLQELKENNNLTRIKRRKKSDDFK